MHNNGLNFKHVYMFDYFCTVVDRVLHKYEVKIKIKTSCSDKNSH